MLDYINLCQVDFYDEVRFICVECRTGYTYCIFLIMAICFMSDFYVVDGDFMYIKVRNVYNNSVCNLILLYEYSCQTYL